MQFLAIALLIVAMLLAMVVIPLRKGRGDESPPAVGQAQQQQMAMCYDIAILPEVTEYVCPVCGEKTTYAKDDPVIQSIPDCRRQLEAMRQITNLELKLDESACCAKCHPVIHSPTLALEITYPDKTKQRIDKVTFDDIKRFHLFLVGKLSADEFVKQSKQFADAMPRLCKALEEQRRMTLIDKASICSMSLDQLKALLRTIETSESPKSNMGAMCYARSIGPDHVEYVCPNCGEKTLYGEKEEPAPLPKAPPEADDDKWSQLPKVNRNAGSKEKVEGKQEENDKTQAEAAQETEAGIIPEGNDKPWKFWQEIWGAEPEAADENIIDMDQLTSWQSVRFINEVLPMCRREMKAIKALHKLDVTLDESACCAKCSPQSTKPSAALVITYQDGSTYRVSPVDDMDLRMLRDLLQGKLSAETFNAGSIPLKERLPRLRELLGIDRPAQAKPGEEGASEKKTPDRKPADSPTNDQPPHEPTP